MNNLVEEFIKLCSIPSPSGNEEEIKKYLVNRLQGLVDELYVDKVGNIYCRKKGHGDPILYCAHMDTVEPAGKQEPVIADGIIYSNGSYVLGADDKIAVAAIIHMLEKLRDEKTKHQSLEILITVREETDAGIRSFPRDRIKAKHSLVSDISLPVGAVLKSAPYVGGYSVTARAPGSHVARATTKTVHPLTVLSKFIERHPYGRIGDDTVTNIAKVRMGESYNSIPQSITFTGEMRTFNKVTFDTFMQQVPQTIRELDSSVGTTSEVQLYPYCEGYTLSSKDLKHIALVMKNLGISYEEVVTFSVGDFNILNEWGITMVNIGNGDIEAHTTRERVAVESLEHIFSIFLHYLSVES